MERLSQDLSLIEDSYFDSQNYSPVPPGNSPINPHLPFIKARLRGLLALNWLKNSIVKYGTSEWRTSTFETYDPHKFYQS